LLGDIDPAMRSGPFGSALLKQELVEAGLPLLGIDNVHTERFVADYTRFVTPKKFAQLVVRYAVRPDDLMITIMGTVGRCCLVPEDIGQALSSKHTWTISLNQNTYSPYLASQLLALGAEAFRLRSARRYDGCDPVGNAAIHAASSASAIHAASSASA